jgi:Family of unknown function (DUF6088)
MFSLKRAFIIKSKKVRLTIISSSKTYIKLDVFINFSIFANIKLIKMKVSEKIDKKLKLISEGSIFRYEGLSIERNEYSAASKKIERLIANGTIIRASKGMFYKPKQTIFGMIPPKEDELLNQYLFKNGRRIAYITGLSLYNKMGLTTQVPLMIEIARKARSTSISIGNISIRTSKSYVEVTNDNYELLGILDAIKDFNNIPDLDKKSVIIILTNKIKELDTTKTKNLINYSLKYPPRVRALLGGILDNSNTISELKKLKKSLNPLSKYKFGIKENILPNASKWNIV